MNIEDLLDAVIDIVKATMRKELGNVYSPFVYGTYNGAEVVDANLSKVLLTGTSDVARYCPKASSVGTLTVGDTVICIKTKSIPLTILCKPVGDISLATA